MFVRFLITILLGWSASIAAAQVAQQPGQGEQVYALGAGDIIEVNVLGREDFRTRARIRPDGTILLPFLGAVQVQGRTAVDVGQNVQTALRAGGYFADPVVSVEVVAYASQYVTVLGAVATPTLVPIDRSYRVSEILARVGGVRDGAADYLIVRPTEGPEQRLQIETLATGDASQDPLIQPGSKIFVPQAELFYIYGEVNTPGAFPIMSEPTLRKALARGGGVRPTGSESRIKVFRKGQQVRGLALAQPIQPGDVIVVGERLF